MCIEPGGDLKKKYRGHVHSRVTSWPSPWCRTGVHKSTRRGQKQCTNLTVLNWLRLYVTIKHEGQALGCFSSCDRVTLTPAMSSTSSVLRVLATWAAMVVPNAMGPEGMRLGGPSLAPVGVNKHKLYWEAETKADSENRNGERRCQITEHNCTGVENVASKCPLHLHCCILPRSKVQIRPLLLLQKQQILSGEGFKYS